MDLPRPFDPAYAFAHICVELQPQCFCSVSKYAGRHNERNGSFLKLLIGKADDAALSDALCFFQHGLDLLRVDVDAAGYDHVVETVG